MQKGVSGVPAQSALVRQPGAQWPSGPHHEPVGQSSGEVMHVGPMSTAVSANVRLKQAPWLALRSASVQAVPTSCVAAASENALKRSTCLPAGTLSLIGWPVITTVDCVGAGAP